MSGEPIRWALAGEEPSTPALFALPDEHVPRRELPGVEYLHTRARSIINEVPPASRLPFRYTINAYRGCSHACTYCFARPTHEYLGMDAGRDFERRLVVKVNAVERLRAELRAPSWRGDAIAMGTNTDPYQPCEGRYRLTRGIIETLAEHRNAFSILTKSTMIVRDLDVLLAAAERTAVSVSFSIGTVDEEVWRASEPGTPAPARRLEAVRRLADAGLRPDVLVAPILPGISDGPGQVEAAVAACFEAGAGSVSAILLHLRPGVREQYLGWLAGYRPDLLPRYQEMYRSAYASTAERERIAERVAAACERHGRRPGGRRARRSAPPPTPPPGAPEPPQLRLV
jgi:DNA repair photolyase